MQITKLLAAKNQAIYEHKNPTIAFLGDSVTQGCFECYFENTGNVETIFDQAHAFSSYVSQILSMLYPKARVNIINAGISGDNAPNGSRRLERDILPFQPDLTIVSYGLNDSNSGLDNMPKYVEALQEIFTRLHDAGSEVIFMTPNMMNTEISPHLSTQQLRPIAETCMKTQLDDILAQYLDAAVRTAVSCGVTVCDVYGKWKCLADNGVRTTDLLSNHINHPTREMNWLAAYSLVECMFQ